jgi:hypothetical protein
LHDLIDGDAKPITDRNEPIPQRVRDVARRYPRVLEPFLRIITGTQIRELTATAEIKRQKWTETQDQEHVSFQADPPVPVYRYDPAIVLCNHYVLAGWQGDEQ